MKIRLSSIAIFLMLIFSITNANAVQLWNNGSADGAGTIKGHAQDDFYVPGGGWWINGVETVGLFLNANSVSKVEVSIWGHNMATNTPDKNDITPLNNINFNTSLTGQTPFGYDEIKISINFDKTYLKGQKYYWIEIKVIDSYSQENFKFLTRQNISLEAAWVHEGSGAFVSTDINQYTGHDLSYAIFGSRVQSLISGPGDFAGKAIKMSVLSLSGPNDWVIKCPAGTSLSPFEMPVYDEAGLFVDYYKTVWFCISDDLRPEG